MFEISVVPLKRFHAGGLIPSPPLTYAFPSFGASGNRVSGTHASSFQTYAFPSIGASGSPPAVSKAVQKFPLYVRTCAFVGFRFGSTSTRFFNSNVLSVVWIFPTFVFISVISLLSSNAFQTPKFLVYVHPSAIVSPIPPASSLGSHIWLRASHFGICPF